MFAEGHIQLTTFVQPTVQNKCKCDKFEPANDWQLPLMNDPNDTFTAIDLLTKL